METGHDSTKRAIQARQPAYRRIAEGVRNQILSGGFAQGTQLPSTQELAQSWRSSYFTIHTALMSLVKEGWIERRNGAGTYVADLRSRFLCAGIYHGMDVCKSEETGFGRNLHFALLEEFTRMGKDTQIFIDSRPEDEQTEIFPPLAEAIRSRRIQCLVAQTTNPANSPSLAKLTLPIAFLSGTHPKNRMLFDLEAMLRESLRRLKEQGCQTVGLMSRIHEADPSTPLALFHYAFEKFALAEGLKTRREWIRFPKQKISDPTTYGYTEFRKLWSLKAKPDGLVVYPDGVVSGVIMALLKLGVQVPRELRLVFHRNAGVRIYCPLPATWATTEETEVAQGLIHLLEDQFEGREIRPVVVPYHFAEDDAAQWQ